MRLCPPVGVLFLFVVVLTYPAMLWAADTDARVIVKFKVGASVLRMPDQNMSDDPAPGRAKALSDRFGIELKAGSNVSDRSQVLMASGLSSADLATRLAAQPEVEYAVVDHRRRPLAVPNDPLYSVGGSRGPAVGQWYLRPPDTTTPAAINAESAWNLSVGSSSVVVAVVDTGVRFDHADLLPVAQGGNLLPGYDFVSDVKTANDGDGRDADASDPGDWVLYPEYEVGGAFAGCYPLRSSWHGTKVAALIGASTNNGLGMASVGRGVRLLPVRVLGKCGGFDSDILAGLRWAAGLAVPGAPANPTPAKVINLSLGGAGACSAPYLSAISEINATGAVVVASGGDSGFAGFNMGFAVGAPANCLGTIAVVALRRDGTKAGFSDLGPEIALAAPGGECINLVNLGEPCGYPIVTATNVGITTPVSGNSNYSDDYDFTIGVSLSASMVSGALGLMFSVNPTMTPVEARSLLQQSARPFPTTGGFVDAIQCVLPQLAATRQGGCYCNTTTCGAGMLDVGAAVRLAAQSAVLPVPSTTSEDGGGGGSFGWPWVAALAIAVGILRSTHRR